jgi:glycosyltransferase involved in cell wall biosynthesis
VKVAAPVPYFPRWLHSKKYSPISKIGLLEKQNGLEVFHPRILVPPKVARPAYGLLHAIFLYIPIKKLIAEQEPDVVLSYWVYPDGFAATLLARIFNKKVILGARGCDVNDHKNILGKRTLLRWAMNRSEIVLAVSKAMKKNIEKLGINSSKIRVIPNGIGDEFRVSTSAIRDKNTILYCGRFSYEKGLQYLIKAAELLVKRQIDFRLVLVGDGPERQKIFELVQTYELTDRVSFEGEIQHERIPPIMERAGLLCLPSLREVLSPAGTPRHCQMPWRRA